jgi:hypothetical protein
MQNAYVVWDVLHGKGKDGFTYTLFRHAEIGVAVELWHDRYAKLTVVD